MEARNKIPVKKNCSSCEPRRVMSVINLTASNFIPTSSPKDKTSKFPVMKPKISRRNSESIGRPQQQDQPTWIAHYRENVARQLNQNRIDVANDSRLKKVTINFCEFLKKKEVELNKLSDS